MKILVSYDKNLKTNTVMELAARRAKEANASVYLVKTCSSDATPERINEIEQKLNFIKEYLDKQGVKSEVHVLIRGLAPGDDIVRFAIDYEIDEIIFGMKKESRVGKLVFGSTVQFIILEAHCPVTTIKVIS